MCPGRGYVNFINNIFHVSLEALGQFYKQYFPCVLGGFKLILKNIFSMCPGRRLKNQIIFSVHWGKVDERVAKAKMTFKWNFFIKVERENLSALKFLLDFVKLQLVRICQLKSFLIRSNYT